MPNATTIPKGVQTPRQKDIVWDPAVGGKRPNTVPGTYHRSSAGFDHRLTRNPNERIRDRKGRRKQLDRAARRRHKLVMSYYQNPQAVQQAIATRNAIEQAMKDAFKTKEAPVDEAAERAKVVVEEYAGGPVTAESDWVEVGVERDPDAASQFAAVDLSDGLDDTPIKELRKMAVALGLKGGWKGPKKAELIAYIRENRP